MHPVFVRQRSIFSTRVSLVASAVVIGLCQLSALAQGQVLAKAIKPPDPPAQPAPGSPSVVAGTPITLNYVRSIAANRGAIPIVSVSAADKTAIAVTPSPLAIPGDLADITLNSTFYGKSFSFTFTNVPADKNGVFTINFKSKPGDNSPIAQAQIPLFYNAVKNTILAKLPVNANPKDPIVWTDPVTVQFTRIISQPITPAPDAAALAAYTTAKDHQTEVNAAVTALNAYSVAVDTAFIEAAKALIPDPVKGAPAAQSFKDATDLKNRVDAEKLLLAKISKDADANVAQAFPGSISGVPKAFDPAPSPDSRVQLPAVAVTNTLVIKLQE